MGWLASISGVEKREPKNSAAADGSVAALQNHPPEFHRFVAQSELDSGGCLQRGAIHLAWLLNFAPSDPDSLKLLEQYLQVSAADPLSLYPESESGHRHQACEAVRAFILARLGRLGEAIDLLVAIVSASQESSYLEAWALNWLKPAGTVESVPPQTVLKLFLLVLQRYPESRLITASQQQELDRYVEIARRWIYSGELLDLAEMTRTGLLRKAGRFSEALQVALRFVQERPGWHSYTAEGLVRREMGDVAGALAAFERAIQYAPDDLADRLEAADMFFDHQQWEDARRWYSHVLESHPDHPWALPSSLYCQWKLTGDKSHLDRIWAMLNENATSRRAYQLYERFLPYLGFLPEPGGTTAEFLRQVAPQLGSTEVAEGNGNPNPEFTLSLTHLEAPSTRLAFRRLTEACRRKARLLVNVQNIPQPDPRYPCRPVKYLLWTYHETEPAPAAPVPRPDVVERIAALALEPYDYQANWASASRVATKFEATDAANILAVMVHPPALPAGENVLCWLPRVQLAAALVLANLEGTWHNSVRRDALLSVLWGAADWTTTAAIIAMTQVARHNETTAADIREAFATLASNRPLHGYCCYEHALLSNWILLPNVPVKERMELEKKLKRIEDTP
ncbi:MAG: tetratricopeptide repeat protein [Pirellulaceae bacterium]|nr:tetratricopeptide repeat protein [Pirellulaceae bacterium]